MSLKSLYDYNIGNTPIIVLDDSEFEGCISLKMECCNQNKSIKDRPAYYMMKSLEDEGKLNSDLHIVESTSGNLGLSLAFFANELGIHFTCLVDPTIVMEKRRRLLNAGIDVVDVEKQETDTDYRCARIRVAKEMNKLENYIWTNQYGNPANTEAHYKTTGPEIWSQTKGEVDFVICAMGSGGTISGIAKYMKEKHPDVRIIGVEPYGSTIFGTVSQTYLSVGAGLKGKSLILETYGSLIDQTYVVRDEDAIRECNYLMKKMGVSVGITTGMGVHVARKLKKRNKGKKYIVVSSDNADNYVDLLAKSNEWEAAL